MQLKLPAILLLVAALHSMAEVKWPLSTPAAEGISPARLEALRRSASERNTRALLIARHGKIVLEWYREGDDANKKQGTASLAKAIVGGSSLLGALQENRLRLNDPAAKYIPEWRGDPQKSKITIRQLATHSSGIEDAEQDDLPHDKLTGWKGDFWKRKPDPITIAINQAPVISKPGTEFHYSNPGIAALGYSVTASLRGAPQSNIHDLLDALFSREGIPSSEWTISYRESYDVDGLKVYATWGGAAFTPRAAARIGQVMLRNGAWEGKQIFSADWVKRAVSYAGTPLPNRTQEPANAASGLCWWTNFDGAWSGVPRDAFAGAGAGQELLLVIPSLDLVMVRNGTYLSPAGAKRFWGDMVTYLMQPAVEAVVQPAASSYPPSTVIRKVAFDAPSTILRWAPDSDNWPMTWGADGDIYTAYGDGHGFEPFVKEKLSLGYATIAGAPPNLAPTNIRSPTGEKTGDGKKGLKASGLLELDGVLYMWVRNAANAELAWSEDQGKTWQWGGQLTEGFGSPAFLNFGRDGAGGRDDFVYVYSQSGGDAYEADDSLSLARVPRNRIRDLTAYELFVSAGEGKTAQWSRDIRRRGPVFSFPSHCQRVDAVYHPASHRYLLALGYNHFSGWGIYDAPTPWGPWTTAFHTDGWDIPETHGYRLPAKWMSNDGRSLYLVFSGLRENDAFCLRRITLDVKLP